jgi:hypothetical protein
MMTTCLITAEAVVGVGGGGVGVVFALPLPGGVLTVPCPQPLRMRVKDIERAKSFRIIFEASEIWEDALGPIVRL